MAPPTFDLQGHRGARGLKSENTLPSFEAAFDLGVSSVETDVHLTADDVPVLFHDSHVSARHCRLNPNCGVVSLEGWPAVRFLKLADMRKWLADQNLDQRRFPKQDNQVTPVARLFMESQGFHPFTPPTLADLFAFAAAYAGD